MLILQHLEKLRYFHKLKDYRSINEASKALGISQGGLSKSIQTLEEILDLKLLVREKNGFRFTAEGELIVKSSGEILTIVQRLQADLILRKRISSPKKLRIGIYDSFAVYFYPELLSYCRVAFPDLSMQLVVDKSSVILHHLEESKVDLIMGSQFGEIKQGLQSFNLLHDHFSLFVKPSFNDKFENLPLLSTFEPNIHSQQKMYPTLLKVMKSKVIHQVTNFETIKQLALLGMGIAVLPTLVAKPLIENRSLVPITLPGQKALFSRHDVQLITSQNFYGKHRKFVDDIIDFAESWSKF